MGPRPPISKPWATFVKKKKKKPWATKEINTGSVQFPKGCPMPTDKQREMS